MRRAALLALLLTGCVRFQYTRTLVDEPVPDELVARLAPGDGLEHCLDVLGPPRLVWEDPRGIWCAYIWLKERGPSLSVSIPTEILLLPSPSLSLSDTKRRGQGVVLLFDRDLRLRFARRGLTDLPGEETGLLDAFY